MQQKTNTTPIPSDSEQFWDWLPQKLEDFNNDPRIRQDSIKVWIKKIAEEWEQMPVHSCGYKVTKTEYKLKGGYPVKEVISCAHCKAQLKTTDRRKEFQELLKKDILYYQRMLREIEEVLL